MQGNEGGRTFFGSSEGEEKRKGQDPGVVTARSLGARGASHAEDAVQSPVLRHPVGSQATRVLGRAQGDMQATSGFQSGCQDSARGGNWLAYEAGKRLARAIATSPAHYEALIAAIAAEVGV